MKIVVIGGTGLIGSKLVKKLAEHGHQAVAASPDSGVNTLTGEGLAEVLQDASVVIDVSNSPSFEEAAVMDFFTTSTQSRYFGAMLSESTLVAGDNARLGEIRFQEWPGQPTTVAGRAAG